MAREIIRLLDKNLNAVLIQDAPESIIEDSDVIIKYQSKFYGYHDFFFSSEKVGEITEYVEKLIIEL